VQTTTMKKRDVHFMMVSKLASVAPITKITRPQQGNTIEELANYIQTKLQDKEYS
jgi:hypothetical protein